VSGSARRPAWRRAGCRAPARFRRLLKGVESGLVATGGACLVWWAAETVAAGAAAASARSRLDRMATLHDPVRTGAGGEGERPPAPSVGEPLGRIEVPRIGLNEVIVEGSDDLTLAFAVGHVPGTSLPGAAGNSALAGHRDGVFAPLARVRSGDAIVVTTPNARFRYLVRSTRVVRPAETWVLDPTPRTSLTLVTCYPFRYVGPAPRRYVVRAELVPEQPARPVRRESEQGRPGAGLQLTSAPAAPPASRVSASVRRRPASGSS